MTVAMLMLMFTIWTAVAGGSQAYHNKYGWTEKEQQAIEQMKTQHGGGQGR